MKKTNEQAAQVFHDLGMGEERGYRQGGWWTPAELASGLNEAGLTDEVASVLRPMVEDIDAQGRAHEVIHCVDVGIGTFQLMTFLSLDHKALGQLGVNTELTPDDPKAAFYSGLFHDMILAHRGDRIEKATPEEKLAQLINPNVHSFKGKAQYLKDPVGDDLRGAVLLGKHGGQISQKRRLPAQQALAASADLPIRKFAGQKLIGGWNLHSVLDAVWYHDGNDPIRGYAEADALIGDRVTLYEQGRVSAEVVVAGIQKLLGYTTPDSSWEDRQEQTDVSHLKRQIDRKAGEVFDPVRATPLHFLDAINGTQTYDFVVDELAGRQRGTRTLNSPAFWRGVDLMPAVLNRLGGNKGLAQNLPDLGMNVAELYCRHVAVQQYRPR